MVVVSVAVAILLGKHAFGGYGHYPCNPAAFGYAVAAVSWPGEVFLYPVPLCTNTSKTCLLYTSRCV